MKRWWLILAISGLVLTLLPSLLVFWGLISRIENHRLMLVGTLLWMVGRGMIGVEESRG